jgi:tetratricopeptide (TPR) repeat protein
MNAPSRAVFVPLSALVAAAAVLCAFVPVAARPGYESSLVLSPLVALASGLVAVSVVTRARRARRPLGFGRMVGAALGWGLVPVAAALSILLVAGLVRGLCDPVQGLGFFAVGPLCSGAAAAVSGAVVGAAVAGRRLPLLAWVLVLLASLAWDGFLVYTTPQVHVHDHLLGHFAGPLYDEDVALGASHLSFRLITAARLVPLALLGWALHEPTGARARASRLRRPVPLVLAAVTAAVWTATFLAEPRLGLRTSERAIVRLLGDTVHADGLVIHLPPGLEKSERDLVAAEARVSRARLEEFFGGAPNRTLVVYMFPDARSMREMTGTGPTSVAKPWLGATTVVYAPPPHPTLEHELAHLFSARWAEGPLRMPGRLWGLLSDPLKLEGVAVAAHWDGDPLDPHSRSAALIRAGIVEDPIDVSGLGFFTHRGGVSYLLSGSFVRHLRDRHGAASLRAWYAGAGFEEAFGIGRREAVGRWREMLGRLDVSRRWVEAMELRYSEPAIWERPCPHQVANIVEDARRAASSGELDRAAKLVGRACAIAPEDEHLALAHLGLAVSRGRSEEARDLLAELRRSPLADGPLAPALRARSGDLAWLRGDGRRAAHEYEDALAMTPEDAERRLLLMKRWAARFEGADGDLRGYLLGTWRPHRPREAAAMLGEIAAEHPHVAQIRYLLGRALVNAGEFEEGASELLRSQELDPGLDLVEGEALWLAGWAFARCGRIEEARDALARLEAMPPPTPALAYRARVLAEVVEAL